MEERNGHQNMRQRNFVDNLNAVSCIRILIIADICVQCLKMVFSGIVLYITRNQVVEEPLKLFLSGYIIFCALKAVAFFSKNRSFFNISRIPEYEDNNDATVLSNLIEGFTIFWYLLGFHWVQECKDCAEKAPLIYYTCVTWLTFGFIMFIAPLVAIVILLLIVSYVKPTLKEITYHSEHDVPDGNLRCVICYENYEPGTIVKFLPCDHHFHRECIDEWFHVRDSCPLCKKSTNILYDLIESSAENPV